MDGLLTAERFVADEDRSIDAIYEPSEAPAASMIRRAPTTISVDPIPVPEQEGPRVSMSHERYLELDRTMHELYMLVEIAISQRDDALERVEQAETATELYASRLKEWKGYGAKLERRLHATQIEELKTAHTAMRALELAEEALGLGLFDGKRRETLAKKLDQLEGDLT